MTDREREPTRDELLAMAYVDGELDRAAREELERRMADEPALAREVAELKKLEVIARQTAPPEPMDHEWNRLRKGLVHRGGHLVGFLFLALGSIGLAVWGMIGVLRDDETELTAKVLLSLLILGALTLFLVILRGRLRTLPYDPYTEVQR